MPTTKVLKITVAVDLSLFGEDITTNTMIVNVASKESAMKFVIDAIVRNGEYPICGANYIGDDRLYHWVSEVREVWYECVLEDFWDYG